MRRYVLAGLVCAACGGSPTVLVFDNGADAGAVDGGGVAKPGDDAASDSDPGTATVTVTVYEGDDAAE